MKKETFFQRCRKANHFRKSVNINLSVLMQNPLYIPKCFYYKVLSEWSLFNYVLFNKIK